LKSSNAERLITGLLGLGLLALGLRQAGLRRVNAAELSRLYQAGFCRSSVALLAMADCAPVEAAELRRRLDRADTVRRFDPERLRATKPFAVSDDGRFWPASASVGPSAALELRWDGEESGSLQVQPYDAPAWSAPLRSRQLVRPDASAYSGLVAYYDLGRVWIADVRGRKFQSLVQEPLLEQGGVLRFSADGTALEFYARTAGRWQAQYLYVLKDR
jgi:hypothetical protein